MVELAVALLIGWPVENRCSVGVSYVGPSDETAVVLARALPTRIEVPPPQDDSWAPPELDSMAVGHGFAVVRIAGGKGDLEVGQTFLAVPWEYAGDCSTRGWTEDGWVPEGELGVFYISRFRTVGEHRVTDQLGWHEPYPHGELIRYGHRPRPLDDSALWLGAEETFDLLSRLPASASVDSSEDYLRRVEAVFDQGPPRWADRFPGNAILHNARREAPHALSSSSEASAPSAPGPRSPTRSGPPPHP